MSLYRIIVSILSTYRGRLMVTIKTEILDSEMGGPSTVYRDKVRSSGRVWTAISIELHEIKPKLVIKNGAQWPSPINQM